MNTIKVALIGNPNTGKTSIFNELTGLNHKVGNYPGITVDKKIGAFRIGDINIIIFDLPGTYSLNTKSLDEEVALKVLTQKESDDYPDVVVVIADIENLKRNLLLFTQVKDLGLPCILALNMADNMSKRGITLDIESLENQLHTKIALVSARKRSGLDELKKLILNYKRLTTIACCDITRIDQSYFEDLSTVFPDHNLYKVWMAISHNVHESKSQKEDFETKFKATKPLSDSELKRFKQKEIIIRFGFINSVLKKAFKKDINKATGLRERLDRVLIHKFWGYVIFLLLLLFIFQVIYDWSSYPMDFIDESFASLGVWLSITLPEGQINNLITQGVIPGIAGVVIFIPQIAFLFLFISILEESGYMSRVVFLTDRIMKRFGLSGKSIVPLVSGTACAIPAVMASRNIENWKERLITILVIPFTTCSARLPVYLIIIALVIPETSVFGFFSYQSITLLILYVLGFGVAVFSAWILHKVLKTSKQSYFVVEMPDYKTPLFKNVLFTVIDKTKSFVFGAGKIILAISIILWVLASYGPNDKYSNAVSYVENDITNNNLQLSEDEKDSKVESFKLRHSFIGYMGKAIEPVVQPLGYDWKIGIAVISSFAAREVFVGTLATIYSVGSEEENTIKNRMAKEVHPETGDKIYNLASGISLLLFYAFAMQCMSTLAIVKRETNSWKWPIIQLVIMTSFAYIVSLLAYQLIK